MKEHLQDEVFSIVAHQARLDKSAISLQSSLKDLGVASLDALEVIFDIEERFKITLPETDGDLNTGTVQGLIDAVQRALAEKESG